MPFDLLVVADGARSAARDWLGVGWRAQSRVVAPPPLPPGAPERVPPPEKVHDPERFTIIPMVELPPITTFELPSARQVTLIAKFAPRPPASDADADAAAVDAHGCPAVALDARTRLPLSPFAPREYGAAGGAVVAAFKRFFRGYCELQLLFDRDAGEAALAAHDAATAAEGGGALPWAVLLEVANLLLAAPAGAAGADADAGALAGAGAGALAAAGARVPLPPRFADEAALRASLLPGESGARLFAIDAGFAAAHIVAIKRNGTDAAAADGADGADGAAGCMAQLPALALVVGDASVSAHYRLGAGVNHAASQASAAVAALVGNFSKAARECKPGGKDRVKFVAAAREANATAKQASVALVGMQNYVTYFEAWCGLVAFGEELFAWEPEAGGERGAGEYTPVSIEDAVASHCPAQPERLDM